MYTGSNYIQVNMVCGLNNMEAVDETGRVLNYDLCLEIILTFLACQNECDNF